MIQPTLSLTVSGPAQKAITTNYFCMGNAGLKGILLSGNEAHQKNKTREMILPIAFPNIHASTHASFGWGASLVMMNPDEIQPVIRHHFSLCPQCRSKFDRWLDKLDRK